MPADSVHGLPGCRVAKKLNGEWSNGGYGNLLSMDDSGAEAMK